MKKIVFILLMFFVITTVHAQEKGSHLTIGGGIGLMGFNGDLSGGSLKNKLGYSLGVGYQYFFNYNLGIATGVGFSRYNTETYFDSKLLTYEGQIDDEGRNATLNLQLFNWREFQTTYLLEIPLMLVLQTKFDEKETFGMYFGGGLKAQIPIQSTYVSGDGLLRVTGYYPEWNITFGDEIDLAQHNLGVDNDFRPGNTAKLVPGLALTGEMGFLIALNPRIDLMLGVSADYGITNIKGLSTNLLSPVQGSIHQEGNSISQNIVYNSTLESYEMRNIQTLAVKGNAGIRIKFGKLKERKKQEEKEERKEPIIYIQKDTIIINPYVIEKVEEEKVKEEVPEFIMDSILMPIYFDYGKSILKPEAKELLDQKVPLLKKYPHVCISVFGHTCDLGSDGLNDNLGFKRAEAVRFYLLKQGIKSSRITTISFGKRDPDTPNVDEKHRKLNRKVEFIIAE